MNSFAIYNTSCNSSSSCGIPALVTMVWFHTDCMRMVQLSIHSVFSNKESSTYCRIMSRGDFDKTPMQKSQTPLKMKNPTALSKTDTTT